MNASEQVRYWRTAELGEVEWLHARYRTHRFARHWHESYALGVIEAGAEAFTAAGARHCAGAGSVVLLNPGDIHDGEAAHPRGWRYRMLYPAVSVLERAASEVLGRPAPPPLFRPGIVVDRASAELLGAAHRAAERSWSRLEREARLMTALAALLRRHGRFGVAATPDLPEPRRMRRVCALIESRLGEDLPLDALAEVAGMSAWHFLRVFRRTLGATPHLYLLQRRLARARALLEAGETPAAAAVAAGFADQSHLTHRFRRAYGVTPGQFRRALGGSKKLQD